MGFDHSFLVWGGTAKPKTKHRGKRALRGRTFASYKAMQKEAATSGVALLPAARLLEATSGRFVELYTDAEALHLCCQTRDFAAEKATERAAGGAGGADDDGDAGGGDWRAWDGSCEGKEGVRYGPHAGLSLTPARAHPSLRSDDGDGGAGGGVQQAVAAAVAAARDDDDEAAEGKEDKEEEWSGLEMRQDLRLVFGVFDADS